jgi:hypothetical protein
MEAGADAGAAADGAGAATWALAPAASKAIAGASVAARRSLFCFDLNV